MCGRFRLGKGRQALKKYFGAANEVEWEPRYNIAPTQDIVTVRQDAATPQRQLSLMRWGLIPSWSKDASGAAKMINARCESAADRPAFAQALELRRCLIPADGFYEWQRMGKSKQPYCIALANDDIFAFAGIWERWKAPDGNWIKSCSILTTSANELVRDVHDRMPVILPPESYDLWLDPGFKDRDGIADLLKPMSAAAMKKYPVSTRVNSVDNDDAECSAPSIQAQTSMFSPPALSQ